MPTTLRLHRRILAALATTSGQKATESYMAMVNRAKVGQTFVAVKYGKRSVFEMSSVSGPFPIALDVEAQIFDPNQQVSVIG